MAAKKGRVAQVGQRTADPEKKEFAGSGVEGKKDLDTSGTSSVVTMRGGRTVRVWFRDGKEIGAEDA